MPFRQNLQQWVNDFLFDRPRYRRWRLLFHLLFWSTELLLQLWLYRDLHPGAKPAYAWVEASKHVGYNMLMYYSILFWWNRVPVKYKAGTLPLLLVLLVNGNILFTYLHDYLILQYKLLPESRAFWQLIFKRSGAGFESFYAQNWLNGFIFYQVINPQSLCYVIKLSKEAVRFANRNLILEQDNMRIAQENLNLELNFLKAQVNPHFFFNTLNSLYSLSIKKSDRAPDLILRLSDLMRYALYNTDLPQMPLQDEIDFLQNYFYIEQTRLGSRIDLTFEVEGDPRPHVIPPLLLIVFVENAFKHGVKNELKQGNVHIRLKLTPDAISFWIANSIPAHSDLMKPAKARREGGIGIENARRRLSILYPGRHSLQIESHPEQYVVQLVLRPAPTARPEPSARPSTIDETNWSGHI
ncbi:sensor histidine kinase [Rudanella lutea]|uniref:sensor histidine kinase n=1 Tax=Rudanella lutea TaxID=451374 RepID=UPI00037801EA|nr:histidine kinase [Rudanella lutea]